MRSTGAKSWGELGDCEGQAFLEAAAPVPSREASGSERASFWWRVGLVHPVSSLVEHREGQAGGDRERWTSVDERGTNSLSGKAPGKERVERALGGAEEQHRLLMECVTDYAIFFLDPQGRVATWNAGAERIFGYAEAEIVGQHFSRFFTPEDVQKGLPEQELQTAATAGRANDDRWLLRQGGARLWCNGVTTALRDEEGRLRGFAKVLRDRTEPKRLEEALHQRAEELAGEARKKDEFLAVLAHELRNPLAPVRNALQVIRLGKHDPALVEQMRAMAERQVGYMTHLVDDLLDLSRISRGLIRLLKQPLDVAEPVRQAVEGVQPLVRERGLTLSVSLPAEPVYVEADPTRLQQVVGNLLSNAAKYTDPGGHVLLTARPEGTELVLRVRDTGIGIAPDMLPRIFDLFVQAERRLDRSQGGLGIGLTLVRRLVEMHGGTVTAHSDGPGQGSEFGVRLSALSAEQKRALLRQQADAKQVVAPPAPRRILVVDDTVDAAESLAVLLRLEGHEVRVAGDGPAALAAAQADPAEMVVLAVGMPGMDGFEVARRLRALPGSKETLLVAVTGWPHSWVRTHGRRAP
jgi:PAS domain S-box-containing protein